MFVCFLIFVCASAGRIVPAQVMTGEVHEVPVNSTIVLRASRFAVFEFNKANAAEEQFAYKIVNITSAKIQVVAGINYILEMKLGRMCKTNGTADREPCVFHCEPKELQCHFIVRETPWEDSLVLTEKKCHLIID
ncbi:cystatin-like [Cottoperca gobio]|uniref:Cystatin-like n=1 Tax=Cottoperca gobio TaxID=56716 RepID=A0A6J2R8T6_COTGO|nr:cystatin-like [Cottoperca gobio]